MFHKCWQQWNEGKFDLKAQTDILLVHKVDSFPKEELLKLLKIRHCWLVWVQTTFVRYIMRILF